MKEKYTMALKEAFLWMTLATCLWVAPAGCGNTATRRTDAGDTSMDTSGSKAPQEFIDLLYADQSIDEMEKIAGQRPSDEHSEMTNFLTVGQLVSQNKKDEAVILLRQMADTSAGSRVRLWAWNGLRELGIHPREPEVLGVIFEVPIMAQQREYLAVYKDGRARYINYTGSVGVWEGHSKTMDELIPDMINMAQEIITQERYPERKKKTAYTDSLRVSFLTTDGLFQTERSMDVERKDKLESLFKAGVKVLGELTEAKDKNIDTVAYPQK